MEIRIIKRSEVIKNEVEKADIPKSEPEKNFARGIEKLITDVRKKHEAERRLNYQTVFNAGLRPSRSI